MNFFYLPLKLFLLIHMQYNLFYLLIIIHLHLQLQSKLVHNFHLPKDATISTYFRRNMLLINITLSILILIFQNLLLYLILLFYLVPKLKINRILFFYKKYIYTDFSLVDILNYTNNKVEVIIITLFSFS